MKYNLSKFLSVLLLANAFFFISCSGDDDDCIKTVWYADADADGFGDPDNTISACEQPVGYIANAGDLDDSQSGVTDISNEEKALAVIDAFESADPSVLQYISDDTYIQHNLAFPDGKAVLEGFFAGTPFGFTATNHRIFSDGNFVVMHNTYGGTWNDGTPQIAFDVFRFDNGLIVEHWDNLQDVINPEIDAVNGNTQANGPTTISNLSETEANKTLVTNMVNNMLIAGKWSSKDDYFSPEYIQHSVGMPNGTEWMANFPEGTPFYASLKFVHGAGNFVLTMAEGYPDTDTGLATAYFDLFRIENGKIIEHWDMQQIIPDQSEWANVNGKW